MNRTALIFSATYEPALDQFRIELIKGGSLFSECITIKEMKKRIETLDRMLSVGSFHACFRGRDGLLTKRTRRSLKDYLRETLRRHETSLAQAK